MRGREEVADLGDDPLGWADAHRRRIVAGDAVPGDLVVFDRAVTGDPADLVAVVIARDARAVLEIAFVAGGVVRRGWLDAAHPTRHRDDRGRTVNSILRFGDRGPPAGTHYLAGELLAAIIHPA